MQYSTVGYSFGYYYEIPSIYDRRTTIFYSFLFDIIVCNKENCEIVQNRKTYIMARCKTQ